jgi:chorismate mutase/prephenate dehydrogenase
MHSNKSPKGVAADLEQLRTRIDAIDQQIVDLLCRRQQEVDQITTLKRNHHLPVYHPAREENLISQRRAQGQKAGLDPDFIEELFRRILRQSRTNQVSRLRGKALRPEAAVLIVGGRGEMGAYFYNWFAESGYPVRRLDRQDWDRAADLCAGIALALLCVPIEATGDVALAIGPYLPADCVLADITSIKRKPMEAMLTAHQGPVVGLHPLFGPTTTTLDKQIVVVTPGRDEPACRWLIDQMAAWGAVLVAAAAEEHDAIMDIVQALRHFATFSFGQFLRRRQIDLGRSLDFSSPIYRLELGMVGRLFAQNPRLYAEIIFASRERRELLQAYVESLQSNLALLQKGDRQAFCEEFAKIAEWFGPFGDQALRESSFLIDKLTERF